jgi:antitoxin FitA
MAQVIIRNLDETVVAHLKRRASRRGRSLEQELRDILASAARADREAFREGARVFKDTLRGRDHSDSTDLIRDDRDR